jgi:hypothetical protein
MAPVKADLRRRDVSAALGRLDGRFQKSEKDLVYLMERGLLLRYAGRLDESNSTFEQAEQRAEDLYTKSVSLTVASLLASDLVLPYEGEDFERVLIHYFRALNYLDLGQIEGALVECRKVERKLQVYEERFEGGGIRKYRTDPFVHYLTGLIEESAGGLNDAYVSYKKAEFGFAEHGSILGMKAPPTLADDLISAATRLGFMDERDQLLRRYPAAHGRELPAQGVGEVVVITEVGFAPVKSEVSLSIPILETEKGEDAVSLGGKLRDRAYQKRSWQRVHYWLRVALPGYPQEDPPAWSSVEVGGMQACLIENVDVLARASLEDRMPRVLLKAIARALTKYLATVKGEDVVTKKHGESAGSAVGAMLNLAALVTEQADLRGWLGLPREVYFTRLRLPRGRHEIPIRLRGRSGHLVAHETLSVDVAAGETAFAAYRFFI